MGHVVSPAGRFQLIYQLVLIDMETLRTFDSSGSASGSGQAGSANANTKMQKKKVDCRPLKEALRNSPFDGLTKNQTKETVPSVILGVQGQSGCSTWGEIGRVDGMVVFRWYFGSALGVPGDAQGQAARERRTGYDGIGRDRRETQAESENQRKVHERTTTTGASVSGGPCSYTLRGNYR